MKHLATVLAHAALLVLPATIPATSFAQAAEHAADARPDLLRKLDGNWVMNGDVLGKPVSYRMVATPALQGHFVEMRMRDVQVPAQYEATVFLGYDDESKTVIAHWMDNHGARHSIPHATGRIDGNTIQFTFAYAGGPFRDTFSYDPATASWRFVLESGRPDGTWKHFARYDVRRR